jgi:cell division septum initiation protein DivIVA
MEQVETKYGTFEGGYDQDVFTVINTMRDRIDQLIKENAQQRERIAELEAVLTPEQKFDDAYGMLGQ